VKYQPVLQTAASGEARFDHDPVTGESKGLLIEEARTNLIADSVPTAAIWNDGDVNFTDNAAVAPDGTQTAALIQNAGASEYNQPANFTIPSGSTITFSTYLKNVDSSYFRLMFVDSPNSSFARTWINGSTMEPTGTITYAGSTFSNLAVSYEDVGNGWYRYSLTADTTGLTTCAFFIATSDSDNSFSRDTSKSYLVWGAQAEEGSFPTSYIPTSGSTVSRAGDNVSITGSNFTDWYDNSRGFTVFAEIGDKGGWDSGESYGRIWSMSDNTDDNFIEVYGQTASNTDKWRYRVDALGIDNSVLANNYTAVSIADNQKIAIALDTDDFAISVAGESVNTDTSTPLPNLTKLVIGSQSYGGSGSNPVTTGTIKKFAYYPKRLPNATLQAMTEE